MPPIARTRGRTWRRHPSAKENLALHDSKEQWFIGNMTFWLGFIGNMDLLARVHRVDLLARVHREYGPFG